MDKPTIEEIQKVAAYWQHVEDMACEHPEVTFTYDEPISCGQCRRPIRMLSDVQIEELRGSPERDAERVRADLLSILGYSCETAAPNSQPTTEFITDRWMRPRLDKLVEYVMGGACMSDLDKLTATLDKLGEAYDLVHTESGSILALSSDCAWSFTLGGEIVGRQV